MPSRAAAVRPVLASEPMLRYGRRRFSFLAALTCLGVGACLSPTLPLPPPEEPNVERVSQGLYRLTGEVPEPATVQALNLRTQLVYGEVTEKRYSFNVQAVPGDTMQLWYTAGRDASDSAFFVIEPELAGDASAPDGGTRDGGSTDGAATPSDAGGGG